MLTSIRTRTDRSGLRLAAEPLRRGLRTPGTACLRMPFGIRAATFARSGSALAATGKRRQISPNAGRPRSAPDGKPYDDDPDSPIGSWRQFHRRVTADRCRVRGVSTRDVSYPVDLVMSYGGGPNVRQKLMRRGADALDSKKLVIWIMTARDLYDHWENWEPLSSR